MVIPPIEKVDHPLADQQSVRFDVLRADLVHPDVSGNKWYKLKYNFEAALNGAHGQILTFGGAYSNHIYAVAALAKERKLPCIGIIRGEASAILNPTLKFASKCGMKLHYLARDEYRLKEEPTLLKKLKNQFGDFYLIPEGGTNQLAMQGIAELMDNIAIDYDYIICPAATGGTLAGIIAAAPKTASVLGISVLKGNFLFKKVTQLLDDYQRLAYPVWQINNNYNCGGFARFNQELIKFINDFYLPLDPIYTGKMFFGINDLLNRGYFKTSKKILAIHTGGLQGIEGFNQRFGNLIINK